MTEYRTIAGRTRSEYIVKKSRFITTLQPVDSLEEGLKIVAEVRKEFSDATHNCYAIVGLPESNEQKCSDDGEPGGTAGQPMFQVLRKNGLFGVVAVVTRYFGGIKLGAGGLVSAYAKAVTEGLMQAESVTMRDSVVLEAELGYDAYQNLMRYVSANKLKVLDTRYGDSVALTLAVPVEHRLRTEGAIAELTAGEASIRFLKQTYIQYREV